jgi:acetyl esterase/lipase
MLPAQRLRRAFVTLAGTSLLAACSPVRWLNRLSIEPEVQVQDGLAYGPLPRQQLDVYRPAGPPPPGGWPMVMFFYGGSWNRGERADYAFVGQSLASRGVLTAVADYRLYPAVTFPAFIEDGALATAWLRQHAGELAGNPERLFVMGHSAGGYNAALLALDPRWLQAAGGVPLAGWIGLAGAYDFLPSGDPEVQPVFHHPGIPAGSQPLKLVRAEAPRSFIGAAIKDGVVNPQRNSVALAGRLREAGVAVELKLYGHVNHPLVLGALAPPLRALAPVLEDVCGFVRA